MGFMDMISGGIGQAAQAVADNTAEAIKSQISQDREQALMSYRESVRQQGMAADDAFQHDPDRVARNRQEKIDDVTATAQANLDFLSKNAKAQGTAEGQKAAAEIVAKATPEVLSKMRQIAAANRDPAHQALLGLQTKSAQLDLDEKTEKAGIQKQIRGLINADQSVDDAQPGAVQAHEKIKSMSDGMKQKLLSPTASNRFDSADVRAAQTILGDMTTSDAEKETARAVLDAHNRELLSKGQGAAATGKGASAYPTITNQAQYDKLRPGDKYLDSQGNTRQKK